MLVVRKATRISTIGEVRQSVNIRTVFTVEKKGGQSRVKWDAIL